MAVIGNFGGQSCSHRTYTRTQCVISLDNVAVGTFSTQTYRFAYRLHTVRTVPPRCLLKWTISIGREGSLKPVAIDFIGQSFFEIQRKRCDRRLKPNDFFFNFAQSNHVSSQSLTTVNTVKHRVQQNES